jgi:hypothetical protein
MTPTPPIDQVLVRETNLSIASYVYEPYLHQAMDEEHDVPYWWLDRAAYGQPSAQSTVLKPFKAIVLENQYLRLTILPDLGGRILECVFKPTGQNIFYRNLVLKPTPWGPLTRERNWWLAAGGMEWAFPVNEHGYEWGVPWTYSLERTDSETKVVLRDTSEARPRARVEIGLAPGSAYFTVSPQVENPTDSTVGCQFWANAMLTLGGQSLSGNTEFVYPTQDVVVHSSGPDSGLPGEGATLSWPTWQGRDLSWYRNWEDWLGFFVPQLSYGFVGAYNHDTGLGVARAFSQEEVAGLKLFGWGADSPFALEYSDDGSQYFEMWAGLNRTFWPEDDILLQPGETRGWTEYWYPFQGIGGLDFANQDVALSLGYRDESLQVGLAGSSNQQGTLILRIGGEVLDQEEVAVGPESPYLTSMSLPAGLPGNEFVDCTFLGQAGEVIASYQAPLNALQD